MAIVSFISSWLKDIVVLFILISIVELVMPKGNMKRYIDLIIGLLIIFTIITPFAKLRNKEFNLDDAVFKFANSGDLLDIKEEDFHLEQEKQVERLYKEKLKNEIVELIQEESIYTIGEIFLEISHGEENYGEIEYLEIIIKEDNEEMGKRKKDKVEIGRIEPVEISKKPKKEFVEHHKDYDKLKNLVQKKYSIKEDKIRIINYDKWKGE